SASVAVSLVLPPPPSSSSPPGDRAGGRTGEADQVGGGELHLQAAPAGRDVDGVVAGGGGVDHGGQPLALAERADAASHVAGGPLGGGRVGHGGLLAARRRGQGLEAQRGADRHHRDGEGAVHLGDQRLEDPVVRDAERVGGLLAVGGAAVPGGLVG